MGEFDDFAAGVRDDLAAKQQAHEQKAKQESDARDALWSAGKNCLTEQVIPILMEAKNAFERQGYRLDIKPNWNDGMMYMRPSIDVQAFGQKKRPHDTSFYEVSGNKGIIWHDGEALHATISDGARSSGLNLYTGADLDAVREVAKRALQSLIGELEPKG